LLSLEEEEEVGFANEAIEPTTKTNRTFFN